MKWSLFIFVSRSIKHSAWLKRSVDLNYRNRPLSWTAFNGNASHQTNIKILKTQSPKAYDKLFSQVNISSWKNVNLYLGTWQHNHLHIHDNWATPSACKLFLSPHIMLPWICVIQYNGDTEAKEFKILLIYLMSFVFCQRNTSRLKARLLKYGLRT